jgi:hypothetical protein
LSDGGLKSGIFRQRSDYGSSGTPSLVAAAINCLSSVLRAAIFISIASAR